MFRKTGNLMNTCRRKLTNNYATQINRINSTRPLNVTRHLDTTNKFAPLTNLDTSNNQQKYLHYNNLVQSRTISTILPVNETTNDTKSLEANKTELSSFEKFIKYGIGIPLFPLSTIFDGGMFYVKAKHSCVVQRFGKYEKTYNEGLHFILTPGTDSVDVFTGISSYNMSKSTVVDKNGNPIIISAIVNFQVTSPSSFVINIDRNYEYIYNQSEAAIKYIASKYTYNSLKEELADVNSEMKLHLQEKVYNYGVTIQDLMLTELSYTPEIANAMLAKQQASAFVDAKEIIVSSALDVLETIEERLPEHTSKEARERILTNLLVVLTSGSSTQPTLPLK